MLAVICHNLNIADKVTGIIENAVGREIKVNNPPFKLMTSVMFTTDSVKTNQASR